MRAGELVVYNGAARHTAKLDQGDALLYPAYYKHEVTPVRVGVRIAVCTWLQSAIRDAEKRSVLAEISAAINEIASFSADADSTALRLSQVKQNLHRLWVET